jgi:hypothetical protein
MATKILYYFILFLNFSLLFSFKCGHDKIKKAPKILNDSIIKNDSTRRLDDSYHPISFFVDYTQINYDGYGTSEYINFIKNSIDSTLEVFSNLIKVKRSKKLIFSQPIKCTKEITRYDNSLVKGVDVDIVLIPIIDPDLDDEVDAAASSCYLDGEDQRPVMGFVLLNQNYGYQKRNAQEFLTMLLLHEITHVLVFSENLFKYFQYYDVTTTKTVNGVTRTLIQTPKVLEVAAQHFGCSSIDGVEIENQGGVGSAGSHWEARIMLGDYMISTDYPEIVISDISLALFEDSGWYKVNYYTGGLFRFGKGQGCSFLNSKCVSSDESNFFWDFCDSYEPRCTSNNLNRGYCYIRRYGYVPLPNYYQYFSESNLGGWEPVDYCPVVRADSSRNYYFPGSCVYGGKYSEEKEYPSSLGFTISDSSICIQSSLVKANNQSLAYYQYNRTMCHKVTCNTDDKKVNVDIGEEIIECPTDGGYVEVDGYNGEILCPPYNRVCTSSTYVGTSIKAALGHEYGEYKGSSIFTLKPNRILISIFVLLFLFI